MSIEIGPRQTVSVVTLPGHGRGRLVWANGPASFHPDEGEPFPLHSVDLGGMSSRPSRTWNRVQITEGGPRLDADEVEPSATVHTRSFSPIFGDGWLVSERGEGFWYRFEDMEGVVKVRFSMVSLCVGRPAYAEKMRRSKSRMPPIDDPDEMNWATYGAADGSTFGFRRGGAPPPEGTFIPVPPHVYRDLSAKAKKAYNAAKVAHEGGNPACSRAASDPATIEANKERARELFAAAGKPVPEWAR